MRFSSIPKAAKIWKVSAATIRTSIKNGDLPAYTFGKRSIRVDLDEIRKLVRSAAERKENV